MALFETTVPNAKRVGSEVPDEVLAYQGYVRMTRRDVLRRYTPMIIKVNWYQTGLSLDLSDVQFPRV